MPWFLRQEMQETLMPGRHVEVSDLKLATQHQAVQLLGEARHQLLRVVLWGSGFRVWGLGS